MAVATAAATEHDQCPWCGSAIAHEKFVEVQARIRAEEKKRLEAVEAEARTKYENQLKESNDKLQQANVDRAALELKMKQAVETAAAVAKKAAEEETARKAAAELARAREVMKAEHDRQLLKISGDANKEKEELAKKVTDLQRELAAQTGQEVESDIDVFQELKTAFAEQSDKIIAVPTDTGDAATIIIEVRSRDSTCGKILIDARPRKSWQSNFASKLHDEMIEDDADHSILATVSFPKGERELCEHKGVLIAHPARVVAIVRILRRALVKMSQAKLSTEQRADKKSKLYDFITSEAGRQKLTETATLAGSLLQIDVDETKAHKRVWEKRGEIERKIQKVSEDLVEEINSIIEGTNK